MKTKKLLPLRIKNFFLFAFTFLSISILGFPLLAGIDVLFKDLDAPIAEQLARKKYPQVPYVPSLRFVHAQIVENMRFLRDSHSWIPDIPVHAQSVSPNSLSKSCPPDFRTSFVQLAFPSPDGVIFLANQATSDPISKLTSRVIGRILSSVEDYLHTSREVRNKRTFASYLYSFLSKEIFPLSKRERYEDLSKDYQDFLKFEFKNALAMQMLRILEQEEEDILKNSSLKRDDPLFYTKFLRETFKRSYPHPEFLEEGEIEQYIRFQDWYKKYRNLSSIQSTEAASSSRDADFDLSDSVMTRFLPFAKKKEAFSVFRFVDVLTEALEEEDLSTIQERNIYPSYIVQRTLITFFWKKAKKIDDIIDFYSGLFEQEQGPMLNIPLNQLYSEEEYYQARAKALEENRVPDLETAMLLSRGFEVFEDTLPPIFYYSTSVFKKKLYPDCVETMIRYLICCFARTKREHGVFFDPTTFPEHSRARQFFEKFSSPDEALTEEARNIFSDTVSNLPSRDGINIVYTKTTYEIESGFINILHVLMHLFTPITHSLPAAVLFEGGEEAVSAALTSLMQQFSREGLTFSWRTDGPLKADPALKDFFGTIILQVNGVDQLKWCAVNGHAYIERSESAATDWRKTINIDSLFSTPTHLEQLGNFLPKEKLDETLPRISPSHQASFLYGLNLKSLETKLRVFKAIASNPGSHFMHPMLSSLAQTILDLQDFHARSRLSQALVELSESHPFLDAPIARFLGDYPRLICGHIKKKDSDPEESKMSLIFWAIQHGKASWIEHIYSTATVLEHLFFPPWNSETSEIFETFLTILPRLERLKYVDIESLCDDSQQSSLRQILSHIEKTENDLKEIREGMDAQKEEKIQETERALHGYYHQKDKILEETSLQRSYVDSLARTLEGMPTLSALTFYWDISVDTLRVFFDRCPPSLKKVYLFRQNTISLEDIVRMFFLKNRDRKLVIKWPAPQPEEKEHLYKKLEEELGLSRKYLIFSL